MRGRAVWPGDLLVVSLRELDDDGAVHAHGRTKGTPPIGADALIPELNLDAGYLCVGPKTLESPPHERCVGTRCGARRIEREQASSLDREHSIAPRRKQRAVIDCADVGPPGFPTRERIDGVGSPHVAAH